MGLLKHFARAAIIFVFLYLWAFLLVLLGVNLGEMLFAPLGILIIFALAFGYSFYFAL